MCGNGIRCYMKYLLDNNLYENNEVDIETGA
jgi:diaminopimelate epimerase